MVKLSKKKVMELIIIIFTIIICLSSYIYISLKEMIPGYELLGLLPLMYMLSVAIVLIPSIFNDFKVFNLVLTVLSFLRYVILPFLIVYADYYGGRSPVPPTANHYDLALKLMLYELLALTLTILCLDTLRKHRKKKRIQATNEVKRSHSIFFYIVFVIVASIGVLVVPGALSSVSFLIPSERVVDVLKTSALSSILSLYLFMIAKQIVALILTWFFYKKYQATKNKVFVFLAVLVMMLNIGVFAGTNRSDLVICMISSLYILHKLFPKHFKKIAFFIVLSVGFIVLLIATVRQIASVSGDVSKLIDFTDTMQVYLGGPYNVAMALEMKDMFPEARHWSVLLYDIFRPMIGINVFIKDLPIDYSVLYYNRRYFFSDKVTQILPMIGQGTLYFGYIGAPIIMVGFVSIAYYFQKIMEQSRNLELVYFLTLATARMGFLLGQNTMNMVNDMSYNLLLFLFIYLLNKKIIYKKRMLNYD